MKKYVFAKIQKYIFGLGSKKNEMRKTLYELVKLYDTFF